LVDEIILEECSFRFYWIWHY